MKARRLSIVSTIPCLIGGGILFGQAWAGPDKTPDIRPRTPTSTKLHPTLLQWTDASVGPVKAWVFFVDKSLDCGARRAAALQQVEQTYNPRATWRRAIRGDNAARDGKLFDDRDLPVASDYIQAVAATGANVRVKSRWLNAISVLANRQQLDAVARLPFVRALQPVARARRSDLALDVHQPVSAGPPQPRGPGLDYGLSTEQHEQINLIALHETGATGAGVIIGMLDTGYRQGHVAFHHPVKPLTVVAEYDFLDDDPNTDIEPGDPSAQHVHGTLILGTLAAYAPGELVGAAYDASYILCKTEDTTAEYQAEEDNYVAGLEFIEANGGDVVNSSLGYIEWYTQEDLDGLTAVTTIAVNTATANGVHCCTSAGNDGNDSDPATSRLLAPSDAFRVLCVGAVNFAGGISPFSADGPSADGRVKPEVLARGVDTFTITANVDTGYNSATGTSISCPLVASSVACLVQAHPEWTVDQMRNVLIRTSDYFVANGTHDPLFVRGYGIINAYAAGLDCNFNAVLDPCDVDCGAMGGPCDVPNCGQVADCNADGIPDDCEPDCNNNTVADACDLANCDPGDAACQDCNRNGIPDECDDPFPQQGRIALDAATYVCQSSATVTVNDCGLNLDEAIIETTTISIQSDSEPAGESVLLTETGADTGKFQGAIALDETDSPGVLLVAHGDTVNADYVDADNGLGGTNVTVTEQAAVDCAAPVVSNVQAFAPGPFDANITFNTDEPATATVRYGLACNTLNLQAFETQFLTSFTIPLSGLTGDTPYFFTIRVVDALGNLADDTNGGLCYTFQTPEIPNYFTEFFDANDNDLDFRSIRFTPDASSDIYAPCSFPIIDLPTDPTGGTLLDFTTEDFQQVDLPPGVTVELYNVSYSTFYVGGNGYITFDAGDDEFSPTLAHHFDQPRVSAFFEFLDADERGQISWKLLANRVAVTWEDVPEFFQTNSNTFQAEMYFDGRIQISHLNLDSDDGLVGLSAGTGVVPGFTESDMSDLGSCGDQPPAAGNSDLTTEMNTSVQIQLIALDDGLPNPPGALTYTILTLPANGTLNDPGVGPIASAPYNLTASDGLVDFIPDAWFTGGDAFQFNVTDGGVPPNGGTSNTASVAITVGTPQTFYSFDMNTDPGWTAEGQWQYGQPLGGGSHDGDPTSGFTGANVYGYNLAGDYPDDLPPTHLITTPMNCSQALHTELHFQRWLGVEYSNFDHATVSASTDGGESWTTVWDHDGSEISDTAWVPQSFDISAIADGAPSLLLRWTMGPTDFILTFPGWNIDDVEIIAVPVHLCPDEVIGDLNNDGTPNGLDIPAWIRVFMSPATAPIEDKCRADANQDGAIDTADLPPFVQALLGAGP